MFKFETVKYIGVCDEQVLTHKGLKNFKNIAKSTIKLFNDPYDLQKYLNEKPFANKYRFNITPKKIKIIYEEL